MKLGLISYLRRNKEPRRDSKGRLVRQYTVYGPCNEYTQHPEWCHDYVEVVWLCEGKEALSRLWSYRHNGCNANKAPVTKIVVTNTSEVVYEAKSKTT